MSKSINGNLSKRITVDTNTMEWTPSPSGSVWRKRVHLVGPPEAGQVTSIVRYEPNSKFPAHDHPDGEEILVLDGVFSDEHGDWPAGTFLLNPEGFRHAPFSRAGCTLFVKLRQFSGPDRQHVVIDTNRAARQPAGPTGVRYKPLYSQPDFAEWIGLELWNPNTNLGAVDYPVGAELFVVDGQFSDENGDYCAGFWLRFPPGSRHHPRTEPGCTLYVKQGLAHLQSVSG